MRGQVKDARQSRREDTVYIDGGSITDEIESTKEGAVAAQAPTPVMFGPFKPAKIRSREAKKRRNAKKAAKRLRKKLYYIYIQQAHKK